MFQSRCHTLRRTLCALPLLCSMLSVWHLQTHYLGQLLLIPLCLGATSEVPTICKNASTVPERHCFASSKVCGPQFPQRRCILIMQLGQWSSDAYLQYFEIPSLSKLLVCKNLPRPCLGGNVHLQISVWYQNFRFNTWLEFCTMLPLLTIWLLLPGWALEVFLDYSYGYWYMDILLIWLYYD